MLALTSGSAVLCAAMLIGLTMLLVRNDQNVTLSTKELLVGENALRPTIIAALLTPARLSTSAVTTDQARPAEFTRTQSAESSQRQPRSTSSSQRQLEPSTGLNPTQGGTPTNENPSNDNQTGGSASGTPTRSTVATPNSALPTTTRESDAQGDEGAAQGGPRLAPILGVIGSFFDTAPLDPTAAFALLAPAMATGGLAEFQLAWQGVRAVTVEDAVSDGNHAAYLTVLYTWEDGRRVRAEQRLVMSNDVDQHIAGAAVLSVRSG